MSCHARGEGTAFHCLRLPIDLNRFKKQAPDLHLEVVHTLYKYNPRLGATAYLGFWNQLIVPGKTA
jgi:hypothetical protein